MTQNSTVSSYSKKTILILLGLVIFNLVSYNLFVKTGGYDASGNYIPYSTEKNLSSSLITFLIGLPIISGIIGLIIGLFPNKSKPFNIKFKRSWWVTLISLNGLFSIGLLAIIIMTILGWHPTPYENSAPGEVLSNKENVIAEFKGNIIQLCDSSNYYLDYALVGLSKGEDQNQIRTKVAPKLKEYEHKLDSSARSFQTIAQRNGLSELEYEQVFNDLNKFIAPMMEKHKLLKEKGFNLE